MLVGNSGSQEELQRVCLIGGHTDLLCSHTGQVITSCFWSAANCIGMLAISVKIMPLVRIVKATRLLLLVNVFRNKKSTNWRERAKRYVTHPNYLHNKK